MKRIILLTAALVLLFTIHIPSAAKDYTMLQWNIWQEGTMVKGGYQAVLSELHRLSPDFVTLSEVRNYDNVDFMHRLADDLKLLGDTFYTASSTDTGLLSKYHIQEFDTIWPLNNDHGTIHKMRVVTPHGDRFAIYTAHLDYLDCASYEPRGYSGNTWEKVPVPESVEEIIYKNDLSHRDEQIKAFLLAAEQDIQDGWCVLIGGDFNEPSYADWQQNTAQLWGHAGFVVPWTVSVLLRDAGFIDTYRSLNPDPVEKPGFTFPSANPDVEIKKLTWAPESDERERIDFIYYKSPREFQLIEAEVFGPKQSIVKSEIVTDPGTETYILPTATWPTDHKGILIRFK